MERLMGNLNQVIDSVTRPPQAGPSQEDQMRRSSTAMTSADAIQRISLAHKDGNFFRLLQLPAPDADELDRPLWSVTDSEISKAYRRLSVLVHPDKNPGPEARQAFEYLNQAYRELRDPEKRAERLKAAAAEAVKARERREAAATGAERLALLAAGNARKRELEKEAVNSFQSEIAAQMQKRVKAAEQRKRAVEGSRYKQYTAEEEGGREAEAGNSPGRHQQQQQQQQQQQRRHGSSGDDEEQQQHRKHTKKSKKEKKEKRDKPSSKRHGSSSGSDSEGQRLRAAAAKKRKKPTFM